ncbi:MAG: sensor histidine kinase [Bacillota bacterium]
MKPLSNLIHRTPWWLLLAGGFLTLAALAIFVTPFHLIGLEKTGSTPEERLAIKREIDHTFSSVGIDVARNVVREIRSHTKDEARREELDHALEEIDQAKENLSEAGAEVARAKREAAQQVTSAVKEASKAIEDAQKQAQQALKQAGVADERVTKSLDESLKAAREAEAEAKKSEAQAKEKQAQDSAQKRRHRFIIGKDEHGGPKIDLDLSDMPSPPAAPLPPLTPEARADIHEKVNRDLRRLGIGAGALLLFVPLFILTIVAKIFIDRSRVSQKVAEEKKREAEYARMSQQVTEAKLQALQAQVEPHFLYNTLASVQALTEVDPDRASEMTGHLIQYLRNALPKMRESISTVAQEIDLVRAYLNILKMRMGDRLTFEIDVPPQLANAPFPPLMLPSLVENAIKHGLEPQREGGNVKISAEESAGKLRLVVADTGRGFTDALGAGVGLANIRERLTALYGDAGKLTLEANSPRGVISTIEVPLDGARPAGGPAAMPGSPVTPPVPPTPEAPKSAARRTLAAMGAAERVWRKGLSFTFLALVIVASVFAGLAIVAVIAGEIPVQYGGETIGGTTGALIGTAAVIAAFALVVLALAVVVAVFYGLGFLVVGLAIFIPLVILVSLVPALAPFILVGLFIWWLVRRANRKQAAEQAAQRKEPTLGDGAPK